MTSQVREVVYINGERKRMNIDPPLPTKDRLVLDRAELWPGKLFFRSPFAARWDRDCTALHRGYLGVWELRDGGFYLLDVLGNRYKMIVPSPILADWFSGELRIADGKIINTGQCYGAQMVFERDWVVEIERGLEVRRELVFNS